MWPANEIVEGKAILLIDVVASSQDRLYAEEQALSEDMLAPRLSQYRAGRSVARRAIQMLNEPAVGIGTGQAGEPLWPTKLTGSISHAGGFAAALLARRTDFESTGVDVNDGRPLGHAAAADLMSADEVSLVIRGGWATDLESARNVVFSAKEALYKCQYPLLRLEDLDFDAVTLTESDNPAFLRARTHESGDKIALQIRRIRIIPKIIHGLTVVMALLDK